MFAILDTEVGTSPVKSLPSTCRAFRLFGLPNSGNVPVNPFQARSTRLIWGKVPSNIQPGISPEKLFFFATNISRFTKLLRSGIDPVKLLSSNHKKRNLVQFPIHEGRVPSNPLLFIPNWYKFVRFPIVEGNELKLLKSKYNPSKFVKFPISSGTAPVKPVCSELTPINSNCSKFDKFPTSAPICPVKSLVRSSE